jgi:16S rRNA (uracil1498-N3)-methyltransferase
VIRVVVPKGTVHAGSRVSLDDDEAHHLQVRRVASGAEVEALDGSGGVGRGRLHREAGAWSVDIAEAAMHPRPGLLVVALAVGDRERFLLAIEKLAELGATRVVPLEAAHTASVASRYREAHRDKAERRMREACKQAGNPWFVEIAPIATFEELATEGVTCWFLADPRGGTPAAADAAQALGWVVGPEGGLTEAERGWLVENLGARPVALAPHVLRFETAAIAAVAVTHHLRGPAAGATS